MLIVSSPNITGEKGTSESIVTINAAARSDLVDGEHNMILLSKAAGGGNELWIISRLEFRVISVLFQDRCKRNRHKFIELQMNQQRTGLALVLHQVKSCCISLFEAWECLTRLVPALLFCCLLSSGSSTALSSLTWRQGGPGWFPLAPMGQDPGGGKHKLQAGDYQRQFPALPL